MFSALSNYKNNGPDSDNASAPAWISSHPHSRTSHCVCCRLRNTIAISLSLYCDEAVHVFVSFRSRSVSRYCIELHHNTCIPAVPFLHDSHGCVRLTWGCDSTPTQQGADVDSAAGSSWTHMADQLLHKTQHVLMIFEFEPPPNWSNQGLTAACSWSKS